MPEITPSPLSLAEKQQALLRALKLSEKPASGFDGERISEARLALFRKRKRAFIKAFPLIPDQIGAEFDSLYSEHCKQYPVIRESNILYDGLTFLVSQKSNVRELFELEMDLEQSLGRKFIFKKKGRRLAVGIVLFEKFSFLRVF